MVKILIKLSMLKQTNKQKKTVDKSRGKSKLCVDVIKDWIYNHCVVLAHKWVDDTIWYMVVYLSHGRKSREKERSLFALMLYNRWIIQLHCASANSILFDFVYLGIQVKKPQVSLIRRLSLQNQIFHWTGNENPEIGLCRTSYCTRSSHSTSLKWVTCIFSLTFTRIVKLDTHNSN